MVEIYALNVSDLQDPKVHPEMLEGLSESRQEKTLRYRQEIDRKQSLGAGRLLEYCLLKHKVKSEEITCGENGKPEVQGIHFNLSHSKNMVVCAVSERPVGCDIEFIGDMKQKVAERFFTDKEIVYLDTFAGEDKRKEFYRLWTMKESYIKMTGEGTKLDFRRFTFDFCSGVKVYREGRICECHIKEYDIPEYKLTICAEENRFSENIFFVQL